MSSLLFSNTEAESKNGLRSMRHEEDDGEQQHAEHRAGETLRDVFGDVRHEHDEGRAHQRSRQPADATDHHAEEDRDGKLDGEAVGRDELHHDGAERTGDAGEGGADAERQRLVERQVDAHGGGCDLVVADRHHGASGPASQQFDGENVDHHRDEQREVVEPHVLRHLQAERRVRLGDDEALHAAGPVLEYA